MRRARAVLALTMFASLGAPGCGGGATSARQPAARAAHAYLAALRTDDPARAYSMLASAVRKDLPYEAFKLSWREHRAERQDQAIALADGLKSDGDLGERARVTFDDGRTATLRREAGAWRLETGLLATTHAATPHVAIERFADALSARSYDDVMRILTSRRREGLGQQVDAFVASLKKQLGDARHRVEFVGRDRAELSWDDGDIHYRVVLRLEGEEWRVDDVHLQPVPAPPAP
jgi:hypothetical protein